jgi:heme/copper-type cytochrome/quinol oxidase subunit 3
LRTLRSDGGWVETLTDGSRRGYDVEVVGIFWYFVDLIWILVFTLLYLIRA